MTYNITVGAEKRFRGELCQVVHMEPDGKVYDKPNQVAYQLENFMRRHGFDAMGIARYEGGSLGGATQTYVVSIEEKENFASLVSQFDTEYQQQHLEKERHDEIISGVTRDKLTSEQSAVYDAIPTQSKMEKTRASIQDSVRKGQVTIRAKDYAHGFANEIEKIRAGQISPHGEKPPQR